MTATLREAIAKVNALPTPSFVVCPAHRRPYASLENRGVRHPGGIASKSLKTEKRIFYVSWWQHDVLDDNGEMFRERFGKGAMGDGWQSFDRNGIHFVGLVNVMNLKAGGPLGSLGSEQLEWLEKDVSALKSSTPIVLFAHIPLWAVYPQWGWGTDDSEQALSPI